jgi:RES domain-containing protein
MRAYRLCRSNYPPYDGEGARRAGGRWNSRGNAVVYMSENRSLALVEILVHLSSVIPDRYVLGAAEIPDDLAVDHITESELPSNWATLSPSDQSATRAIGDRWIAAGRAVVLSVPSVISGERNYALNPTHPAFGRIAFAAPIPFHFDLRLVRQAPVPGHNPI